MNSENQDRVELGGRAFAVVGNGTVERDLRFTQLRKLAGMNKFVIHAGESVEEFASRLAREAAASGVMLQLLGALIVPLAPDDTPVEWSLQTEAEVAKFVGNLRAQADKNALQGLMASMLVGFFVEGISSIETSQASSGDPAVPASPTTKPIPSGSGEPSSARSEDSDPSATSQ